MERTIVYDIYSNKAYAFKSKAILAKLLGISKSAIYRALREDTNYWLVVKKYLVVLESDYNLSWINHLLCNIRNSPSSRKFIAVNNQDNHVSYFTTLREAGKDLDLDYSNIAKALKGEVHLGCYSFYYQNDIPNQLNKLPRVVSYKEGIQL